MTDAESTADLEAEVLRGIEGVEATDDGGSSGLLPFDPRRKGPKDVYRDTMAWASARRYWLAGSAIAAFVALQFVDVPISLESVPPWGWVALAAGIVALPFGVTAGIRTGKLLSPSSGTLISILDGRDGSQELLRIDDELLRDLTVLDHAGEERPRDYLRDVSVNGEQALEVDVYYPRLNVAVASWQAGSTNHEIRRHEHEVDLIKTELDRRAQAGLRAEMEQPQAVAQQVRKHSQVLVGAVEDAVTLEDVDLDRIRLEADAEEMDPSEDHLSAIEAELVGGDDSNGHDEDVDRIEELQDRALETIGALADRVPGRGGDSQ